MLLVLTRARLLESKRSNAAVGKCTLKVLHGGLTALQKLQLCGGSPDDAPARCANALAARGVFAAQQLADVCSEAVGTGPAECALAAYPRAGRDLAAVMCGAQSDADHPFGCFTALRRYPAITDSEAAVLCRGSRSDFSLRCAKGNLAMLPVNRVKKCGPQSAGRKRAEAAPARAKAKEIAPRDDRDGKRASVDTGRAKRSRSEGSSGLDESECETEWRGSFRTDRRFPAEARKEVAGTVDLLVNGGAVADQAALCDLLIEIRGILNDLDG
jgi:hypothetical protein